MSRFAHSLYARLALVLLLALGASFATMYFLFQGRLADTRDLHLARALAAQVNLVEAVLRAQPRPDLRGINDLILAHEPPLPASGPHPEALTSLRQALIEELGRDVELVPADPPASGVWVSLHAAAGEPGWMLVPVHRPPPHPRRSDSILTALLVGFAVFFAGGLALLWQVQRPLKRLGEALAAVGKSRRPSRLPQLGPGELRALGRSYNEMVDRLQTYEEDRATMLAGVAHDLRTPITRLRLLVELGEGPRGDDIVRNLDDIERITEQFLVYAKDSDDEPTEQRDLDLFVQEVAAPYAECGVAVQACAGGANVALRSNALRRGIVNLIENALEYGAAPVTVRVERDGSEVRIAIEDNGPGIPAGQIGRALRPFSRLDASRGGKAHCGLGLVIAAKAAEAHGGTLEVRNRTEGGLCAEIRWPG